MAQALASSAANVITARADRVATPEISPNGGAFTPDVLVTLTSATSGAEIRYTINGTHPDISGILYLAPFLVGSNTEVRAIAYKDGMVTSFVTFANFTVTP